MYKKQALILLLLLFTAAGIPIRVLAAELEYQDAEILLVYNNNPTQSEIADIQIIVQILTYQQFSVVYTSMSEAGRILDKYDAVLCYRLEGDTDSFMEQLAGGEQKVFLIGSGGVTKFVTGRGYDFTCYEIGDSIVDLDYQFAEDNDFKALMSLTNGMLLTGDFTYVNGTISMNGMAANLYSRYDSFVYLPVTDLTNSLLQASFTKEIARWLWPYKGDPHTYAQYIVLDEVYPFTSPEKLMEAVDYFIDSRLPFVISVMPIFENGDYPAMKRFCEILRYAQANGGAIIMHSPNYQQEEDNVEQVLEYLTIATEAYANQGIYPIGLEVPEKYMFIELGREILQRYSTLFFFQDDYGNAINLEAGFNSIYKDGHKMIASAINLNQLGNSQILSHPTALYIKITEGMDALKKKVNACTASAAPLKNLWETDHVVYANNLYLYTKSGQVYMNNEKVSLDYIPFEYDSDFDYKNGVFHWIMTDLQGLNNKLVFVTFVSSAVFLVFILHARRINKHKFLLEKKGGLPK